MIITVYSSEPTLPALNMAKQLVQDGRLSSITVYKQCPQPQHLIIITFTSDGKVIPTVTEKWEFINSAVHVEDVTEEVNSEVNKTI
jgi:hypothetical protein